VYQVEKLGDVIKKTKEQRKRKNEKTISIRLFGFDVLQHSASTKFITKKPKFIAKVSRH
tara:strand:+ start:460 stop:636 length:177 start_codon:yes stop_codon:yes gene_type:complete